MLISNYFIENCISPTAFQPLGFNFRYLGIWASCSYVKRQFIEYVSLECQGGNLPCREVLQVPSALLRLGMEQRGIFLA